MRADIAPGAAFPDYELSDHRGMRRTLSELQGGDPLVLVNCRLVTISTDNLLETNEFRAAVGAHWTFLSDPGRKLQKDLDIAEYTARITIR
jgi:peroxiredoxin